MMSFPPLSNFELNYVSHRARSFEIINEQEKLGCTAEQVTALKGLAAKHFELGCWLFYYHDKLQRFDDRVACALMLFKAGFPDGPGKDFEEIFLFSPEHFASMFRHDDTKEMIAEMSRHIDHPKVALAFIHNYWEPPEPMVQIPLGTIHSWYHLLTYEPDTHPDALCANVDHVRELILNNLQTELGR